MYVLVLEASTTSAKALLYNKNNKTYQVNIKAFDKFSSNGEKHDAKKVFDALIEVGKDVITSERVTTINSKSEPLDVDAIVLVTTWHNLLWLDKEYQPIGHAFLWSYGNKEEVEAPSYFKNNGCPVSISYPLYKGSYAFDELCDEDKEKIAYLGDEASYFMYRLTGDFVTSANMASGTGFYHLFKGDYDQVMNNEGLKSMGISRDKIRLPKIGLKGYDLNKTMADELGIHQHARVCLPYSDGGMNHVCVMKGYDDLSVPMENIISMSVGTSGAIRKFTKEVYLKKGLWCYSLMDGYIVGGATASACNIVDYYKERLFEHLSYDDIEEEMQGKGLEENSPIYLPFEYGERSPGYKPNRKGGFIYNDSYLKEENKKDKNSDRTIQYMAVLEGVLFNLYQCYQGLLADDIENEKRHTYKIILSGGILHSKIWTKMCCDIFNTEIIVDHKVQSSLFGGLYMVLDDEEIDRIKNSITLYPDVKKHAFYKKRYKKYITEYTKYIAEYTK